MDLVVTDSPINATAVGRGALMGLVALLPVVLATALAESNIDDFDTSGWAAVAFLALLAVYAYAGYVAGTVSTGAPLTNGSLAGIGTFVLWLPLRFLIWLVRGDQGLVNGDNPVFNPGAILLFFVVAGVAGMLGAILGARRTLDRAGETDSTSSAQQAGQDDATDG